ncbi:hypothetical protein MPSEU_000587200 [Mayamaea pseudoterrestris]|nr:hypothetical protein MPSEU_000587200 [Mayamaea pseudoterrestris]
MTRLMRTLTLKRRAAVICRSKIFAPSQASASFSTTSTAAASNINDTTTLQSPSQQQHQPKAIYVSATRQHVGKTSVSLALMSGLSKRLDKVGFIKPVGQQSVQVMSMNHVNDMISVDKDAALIKSHFQLDHLDYSDTSPILIPPGYTKDYMDGKFTLQQQETQIMNAYQRILTKTSPNSVILCEGTGHCAVGSIVQLSNAHVASMLNAHMVLVANGGLGNAYDELELNRHLCEAHHVPIAGVVINKVQPEKYEQTKRYMTQLLRERWNVPLLGLVPDRQFLGSPALADMEKLLPGARIVSGNSHRLRHYRVKDLHLVATSLSVFLNNLRKRPERTLYVCHASRNDILLGFLMESQIQMRRTQDRNWETAMIVTGCADHPISTQVLEIVTSMPHAPPVLLCPQHTSVALEAVYNFTPKLNMDDSHRVRTTVDHYEPCIDFDLLLERVGVSAAADPSVTASASASAGRESSTIGAV